VGGVPPGGSSIEDSGLAPQVFVVEAGWLALGRARGDPVLVALVEEFVLALPDFGVAHRRVAVQAFQSQLVVERVPDDFQDRRFRGFDGGLGLRSIFAAMASAVNIT